jgi:N-acetylglutamate synthase/N-acetylornithine aminotransferase
VLDSAKPSSRSFSDRAVRVKLIEASDTGDKLLALVENDGVVRFATGKEGMISARRMETLKKVIDPQCSK